MSKATPSRRARRVNNETEYGFEYWYQRYRNWVLAHKNQKVPYVAGALVVAAALIAASSLLSLPQQVATLVAFPAGVLFFLVPLGILFLAEESDPHKERFKDRVPPSRRRRFSFIGAVFLVVLLLSAGNVLPYALGGSIMVAAALGLYNVARRTPQEIALALAGIPDPRETVVLTGDEQVDEDALADTEEETDLSEESR